MSECIVIVYVEVPEGEEKDRLKGMRVSVPGWSQDFRCEVMGVATLGEEA